jgi:hypothetical protein
MTTTPTTNHPADAYHPHRVNGYHPTITTNPVTADPAPTTPDRTATVTADHHTPTTRARHLAAATTAARTLRLVGVLLLVNGLAVYGQIQYAYHHIAPADWSGPGKLALGVVAAAAIEAIALYVGWHAHDALLMKAYTTARNLRVASYAVAAIVATVNYAHFAAAGMRPTAAAIMFGLVSLLSPWLWGLHTRRAQHIQLVREDLIDEAGTEFSARRRRHFPIRSWKAGRWAIEHNVRDPYEAWDGYHRAADRVAGDRRERKVRDAESRDGRKSPLPVGVGKAPTTVDPTTAVTPTTPPTTSVRKAATATRPPRSHRRGKAPTTTGRKVPPVAIRDAAFLRVTYGTVCDADLPGRNQLAELHGWNRPKAGDARNAYLEGADLNNLKEQS